MSRPGRRKTKRWKRKRAHARRVFVNRVAAWIRRGIMDALTWTDDGIASTAERLRQLIEDQGHLDGRPIVPGSVRVTLDPGNDEIGVNVTAVATPIHGVTLTGIISI